MDDVAHRFVAEERAGLAGDEHPDPEVGVLRDGGRRPHQLLHGETRLLGRAAGLLRLGNRHVDGHHVGRAGHVQRVGAGQPRRPEVGVDYRLVHRRLVERELQPGRRRVGDGAAVELAEQRPAVAVPAEVVDGQHRRGRLRCAVVERSSGIGVGVADGGAVGCVVRVPSARGRVVPAGAQPCDPTQPGPPRRRPRRRPPATGCRRAALRAHVVPRSGARSTRRRRRGLLQGAAAGSSSGPGRPLRLWGRGRGSWLRFLGGRLGGGRVRGRRRAPGRDAGAASPR